MSIEFKLGNGKALPHSSVSYNNGITFVVDDASLAQVEVGLTIGLSLRITVGDRKQMVMLPADTYTVEREMSRGYNTIRLRFNDVSYYLALRVAVDESFLHLFTSTAAKLAKELTSTLIFQSAQPLTERKRIVVHHRSPVEMIAPLLVNYIGVSTVCPGMLVSEFYRKYTPEEARSIVTAYFCNRDLKVTFIPHDGKQRELFRSHFGERLLEFAEQARS